MTANLDGGHGGHPQRNDVIVDLVEVILILMWVRELSPRLIFRRFGVDQ
jgi:hypothetical protein